MFVIGVNIIGNYVNKTYYRNNSVKPFPTGFVKEKLKIAQMVGGAGLEPATSAL